MSVFDKKAMHKEAIREAGWPNDNHWEAVVGKVCKVRGSKDFINAQTDRMVELKRVDGGLVFFGCQPKTERGFE
jgi:hypothetical protein